MFGVDAPEWKFIAPRSPWWGGWWERLVRSVKLALKKSVGVSCLTRIELETTLTEIEACVNSRPLTFVGDTCDSVTPLTPAHFLIGRSAGVKVEVQDEVQSCSLSPSQYRDRYEVVQQRMNLFWSRWSNDYLRALPPVVPGSKTQSYLKVGSVVLIKDENLPKIKWPLGKIIELHPGRDNIVRSVTLKTAKGVIKRSIQCLRDLEVVAQDIPCKQEDSKLEPVAKSKYGRVLKPGVKYSV